MLGGFASAGLALLCQYRRRAITENDASSQCARPRLGGRQFAHFHFIQRLVPRHATGTWHGRGDAEVQRCRRQPGLLGILPFSLGSRHPNVAVSPKDKAFTALAPHFKGVCMSAAEDSPQAPYSPASIFSSDQVRWPMEALGGDRGDLGRMISCCGVTHQCEWMPSFPAQRSCYPTVRPPLHRGLPRGSSNLGNIGWSWPYLGFEQHDERLV
jgi:hypothetical protein